MNRKWISLACFFGASLLAALVLLSMAGARTTVEAIPPAVHNTGQLTALQSYTYTTVITVTSTNDPDTSPAYTCYRDFAGPPGPAPDGICTLRRAIVEASEMAPADRPTLIAFDIPMTDTGYIAALDVWKVEPLDDLPYVEGGRVIIDGTTQPGGRLDGPKIIVAGQDLQIGLLTSDNNNTVRGLALQGGGIYLNSSANIIENNWVGLADDGQSIYYVDDDPTRSNYATIYAGATSDGNTIRYNVVATSKGVSIVIGGDDNIIVGNYVGTRADGTIADVPENRRCHADARYYNWFTGDGIHISGDRNQVGGATVAERNVIAGMLFASEDPDNTPPEALEVHGNDNTVQNNYIGKDATGKEVGVCGTGIYVNNKFNQFLDNDIIQAGTYAFGIFGTAISLDGITLRGNAIKDSPDALVFGPTVPISWTTFNPAKVTNIAGTTVSGTSGDASPCANCVIELFLDDGDVYTETLQSMAVVTAAGDGSWTATLAETLPPTRGLRTASTTVLTDQIPGFSPGTTSRFSALYPGGVTPPEPTPPPTPAPPPPIPTPTPLPTPEPPASYNTVITVTSTSDPDTSSTLSCYSTAGGTTPASPCTLRRAIVEASAMDPISRPVLIKFDLLMSDPGYTATLDAWKIVLIGDLPYVSGGEVTIDGETQPSGRADGPKIIVEGASIRLGEIVGEDSNMARGLAVQAGEIAAVTDGNIIQNCWVGLSGDGQTIYYIDGNPEQSNYATIRAGGDNNLIQDNVSASSQGVSIDISGDDNVIVGNYVGTRADGTLLDVSEDRKCHPDMFTDNWFTGIGMDIGGARNRVGGPTVAERNVIAGMLSASTLSTTVPPEAMTINGEHHVIQNNYIGKDVNGQEVWVCGTGMDVDGRFIHIQENTIVNAGSEAIGIDGSQISLDAIEMRGNTIKNSPDALAFSTLVPSDWKDFNPAQVTRIDGTTLWGASGEDSPCPYCLIELFLDDADVYTEALQSLAVVTASASGEFTVTLSTPFTSAQRIRTTSTALDYGIIENFEARTTSKLSEAQVPSQTVDIIALTGGSIVYTDAQGLVTSIQIPSGALEDSTSFTYTAVTTPVHPHAGLLFAGRAFDLDASSSLVGPITITLTYRDEDLAMVGIDDEGSLRLYYWTGSEWDDAANTCTPASVYVRDKIQNELSVEICHLTSFGLFGSAPTDIGPGSVEIVGPTTGIANAMYSFTATVSPPSVTVPITFTWQATDKAPVLHSAGLNDTAVFTWGVGGPKTITVTAANAAGVVDAGHVITVYEPVVAGFYASPTSGVAPLTVFFTNTSTGGYDAILWHFGDEATSTVESPSHTYTTAGMYTVTLTASGMGGSDTLTRTNYISVSAGPACTEVTGVDLSLVTAGTIYTDTLVSFNADIMPDTAARPYTYTIDYGDGVSVTTTGSTDPLTALTHTFTTPGTFTVGVTVRNCDMTEMEAVTDVLGLTVHEQATCVDLTSITIAGGTTGYPGVYTFTTSHLPPDATQPITYLWDNGDSTATSIRSLTVGTHTLMVTATNCADALVTDTHTIVISTPPIGCPRPLTDVSISGPTAGYTDTLYHFTAAIVPPDATQPVTYTWSPTPTSGQGTASASYWWAVLGTHTITLTARNCASPAVVTVSDTHAISISGSPPAGDAYEEDDTCAQASTIPVSGTVQVHSFHDQADKDWISFQATVGITYVVEVRIPPTSTADVVLELYDSCDPGGSFDDRDPTFSPDIRLSFIPPDDGTYYLRLFDTYTTTYGNDAVYHLSVRALQDNRPSGAIILVAGRLRDDDQLQDNIHYVTNQVYEFALAHGCAGNQIRYLATDTSMVGVTGLPTKANLEAAITDWAKDWVGPGLPLTLYLMDHGTHDLLYLDKPQNQWITPLDLDGWLDRLEADLPGVEVNVVVEACYSGSFIDLDKTVSGPGRVVIASTSNAAVAYASQEGAAFSDTFLQGLKQGTSLYSAFEEGSWAAVQGHPDQRPWLDDDGDGVPNGVQDGEVAAQRSLACATLPPEENWPPHVAEVEVRNLSGSQAEIWAKAQDDKQILGMSVVIYPPSYQPPVSGEEMIKEPVPLLLVKQPEEGQYAGVYGGFDEIGEYRLVVYAVDNEFLRSRPKEATVRAGWPLYLPVILRIRQG